MKKQFLTLLLCSAFLANAAPPDLGAASGAAANRKGSNVVLPDFLNNLGGTTIGTAVFTMADPGNDYIFATNGGGVFTPVLKSALPVSAAVQTALDLKAPLDSPQFTGYPSSIGEFSTIGTDSYIHTAGEWAAIYTTGTNAGIYTSGANAPIRTLGTDAVIRTLGTNAHIYTAGSNAQIFTGGTNASIYTSGSNAGIFTQGATAHIHTNAANIYTTSGTLGAGGQTWNGSTFSGNQSFSGTLTASNLSGANTGDQTTITGNAGTASAVAASGITGTTLASNVVNSSLTSAAGGTFGTAAYTAASAYATAAQGVTSLSLATANVIFATPINFANTSGAWTGTLALNSQAANTLFGNFTAGSATPTFSATPKFSGANITALSSANITASTTNALGIGSVELGHATDTTLSRASAGRVAVEGVNAVLISSTDTLTNKSINWANNTITFTSALATAACSDETGSGSLVFATSPTLVTPILGTPASGNASNMTVDGTNPVGFRNIPQNSQSAAYTFVMADAGKHAYHPSADTTARTWTIDSNANVAYPIGTALTFVNDTSAGTLTISITSDTLVLAGAGTTGSRTLTANGVATAIKVTSTRWIISGTNLN